MPWCYTLDPNVIDDICDIPLCSYQDCRLTGPGIEYSGFINRTASDRSCVVWSEKIVHQYELDHNKTLLSSDEHKRKLPDYKFPEGSRNRAMNRCRNPSGSVAGPWCLVERETLSDRTKYDMEFCNVPFCEQPDCPTFTSGDPSDLIHTHYSSTHLMEDDATVVFGLRLWNPEQWNNASFRVAFSMIPLVGSGQLLRDLNVGVEILVTMDGSELTLTDTEESEFAPSDTLIDFTHMKYFAVNWAGGFISFGYRGHVKPLWIGEYNEDESSLIGFYKGVWKYISILGVPATWSFPFCKQGCEEHITLHSSPVRMRPLRRSPFKGYELQLHVRAHAHAIITLRPGPGVEFPRVNIVLAGLLNKTLLTVQKREEADEEIVVSTYEEHILSYWMFTSVKITIIGDKIEAYWLTEDRPETSLFIKYEHRSIRDTRWFSIASNTVAHWTLYCQPNGSSSVPKPEQPDCVMEEQGGDYNGTQWTSHTGGMCLPWNSKNLPQMLSSKFPDSPQIAAANLCRNPTQDPNGPFCFTLGTPLNLSETAKPRKEYCKPRFCQSAACKLSGLGTDFFGLKSITRSGRTCQSWNSNFPHKIDKELHNDDLYPSRSVKQAKNYCRNPSRGTGGPWCYTTDPLVARDGCDVTDCDKQEQCTLVITESRLRDRQKYILPLWRSSGVSFSLKVWDPLSYDAVHVVLERVNASGGYLDLVIGYNKNEYVALLWTDETGEQHECTSLAMPHLIAAAKWTGFWLKLPLGQVLLGLDGSSGPIFEWKADEIGPCPALKLDLIGFYIEKKGRVGASFDCRDCHTEITRTDAFDQKYSMNMWKPNQGSGDRSSFSLHVRCEGAFKLGLFRFPESAQYLQITFSNSSVLIHSISQDNSSLQYSAHVSVPQWTRYNWSELTVEFTEQKLNLSQAGQMFLEWSSSQDFPLIYYHLSLASTTPYASLTWTLNCPPPDIDDAPRNGGWGGWGPWACSVPCGGGSGTRVRRCNAPPPNILGAPCPGSDTQVGRCNTFPCGQVSPYTNALIRESLKREAKTIFLKEGLSSNISCDLKLMRQIAKEAPTADFEWNKNGFRLGDRADVKDFTENNFTLNLTSLQPGDSGLYACIVFPDTAEETRIVVSIFSVLVTSELKEFPKNGRSKMKQTQSLLNKRVGDRWKIMCNSGVLVHVYEGLVQRWLLNGTVYLKEKYVAIHSERDVINVNSSQEGVWECQVSHKDLNLTWTTNWTRLHVLPRATLLTYLLEDEVSSSLLGWLGSERNVAAFLKLLPLLVAALVLLSLFIYRKWEKDVYGNRGSGTSRPKYVQLAQTDETHL